MVEYGEGKCQSPKGISSLWLRYAGVTINPQILVAYDNKGFFFFLTRLICSLINKNVDTFL